MHLLVARVSVDVFCTVRVEAIASQSEELEVGVRWPGRLSLLRVADMISEKLVPEVGDSSGTQRKGNFRCWKPLPSNG
jgi:hypothetical protein